MATTNRKDLLIARQSFQALGRVVTRGMVVDADDPIVKGREALFERAEDRLRNTRRSI